ncbi:hypothetical protein [Streptomyces sp. NPDC051016]|uniref:hypothetical protein n=1 Tax=Streptomyces sp. NPDC051016 TaxID=3365638 RepID=UPI003792C06B
MTTRTLHFRGRVVGDGAADAYDRARLLALAEQFPVGTRVRHLCGREGVVALDQPEHVPGLHLGDPAMTAICMNDDADMGPMLFVSWENEYDLVWRVWVPVHRIRIEAAPAVNRPGNRSVIGGRR